MSIKSCLCSEHSLTSSLFKQQNVACGYLISLFFSLYLLLPGIFLPSFPTFSASCLSYVPDKGTVGASGDLAPLSHLALGLMGEGKMWSPETGWADASSVSACSCSVVAVLANPIGSISSIFCMISLFCTTIIIHSHDYTH